MSLTIAFDLDGTLIDSVPQIADCVNRALADRGIAPLARNTVQGFVGRGLPALVRQVAEARQLPEAAQDPLHDRILALYTEVDTPPSALYPGVRAALGVLKDQGHSLAICTNKPYEATLKCLADTGLALDFDRVIGGDSLPTRKPDPAMLHAALDGAARALYVGDSETDAETADAAQVPFLLFTEGYRKSPIEDLPHKATFSDFTILPQLVNDLS
ncbi:phosphoglycolate phosphatase [Marinovum sp.]|uniref:phosphoglycolate phosphatase n=1 Tax=Marinovum sp. TaxID=2024839 RepID=UPI002B274E6E|nr:phosphoglycolate phosphatase [Marinovum sp.]